MSDSAARPEGDGSDTSPASSAVASSGAGDPSGPSRRSGPGGATLRSAPAALARFVASELRHVRDGREVALSPIGWRKVFAWSALGLVIGLGIVWLDYTSTLEVRGPLVVTESIVPAAPILEADLGPEAVNSGGPHDGAFFYVIARQPMHPDQAAEGLDRPRYRLQRIAFPILGWALHPSGGGQGLVNALFAVGVVGVFAAAASVGALSRSLGGPAWIAAVVPLLGGSTVSLRITTPDPLAAGLAFLAVLAALHRRTTLAVVLGIGAVLTKETMLVVLVGFAVWQGGRRALALVAFPAAVAAGWWVALRVLVETHDVEVIEFTTPFAGWVESVRFWAKGYEGAGLIWFSVALVLGVAALVRGRVRHPLGWVVVANMVLLVPLIGSALAPERSAGRTTLPMVMAALVVLVTPWATHLGDESPEAAGTREGAAVGGGRRRGDDDRT